VSRSLPGLGGFVGREDELARLADALDGAIGGNGVTVLLTGEAGIGKTRLVGALAELARERGAQVRTGRCIDLVGAGVPFLAFVEALRKVPGDAVPGDAPFAGPAEPETDAQPDRRLRLFEQVRLTLEHLSAQAPLVLVLEDVHWADASTLDLVAFLAHAVEPHRVLILLTYRSDELAALPRTFGGLCRAGVASAIALGPLAREALTALLERTVAADLAAAICVRSGGNPFFAEELLAAAVRGERTLPAAVRDALLQRVSGLDDDGRAVVELVAVAGHAPGYRLLAASLDMPPATLQRALRAAVDQHILVADQASGTYRFRHALFGEAIYAGLLPGEREDQHARLALAMTEHPDLGPPGAVTGELARHWAAADRPVEAFTTSLDAAREAESVYGLAEALVHLERVIALWHRVPEAEKLAEAPLADILARAAEHADDTGNGHRAAELVRRAIGLLNEKTEPLRVALLYERLGSYLLPILERDAGIGACRRAVELVPAEPPSPQRVRVLAALGHAMMLCFRHAEARPYCEEAIAVAERLGEPERAARPRDVLGVVLCYLGQPAEGLALLAESCAQPLDRSAPERLVRPLVLYSDTLTLTGRLAESVQVARRGLVLVRELGWENSVGRLVAANIGEALLGLGDWDGADEVLSHTLRMPGDYWSYYPHMWRAQLMTGRGDFEVARRHVEAAAEATEMSSAAPYLAYVAAELAIWGRRLDDAAEAVDGGLASAVTVGAAYLRVRLCALGLRVQAEVAQDAVLHARHEDAARARERAESLYEEACRAGKAAAQVTPDAAAWRALADAEYARVERKPAPERWAAAAAAWDDLQRPYHVAYCSWRHAEALLAAGATPADATPPARQAHDIATRLDAAPLRREVELLAKRARLHLSAPVLETRPASTNALGLTAREAEVLQLLSLGYTNRDIAIELTISVKTASVHVSHILRKLDATNRIEAAAIAHRLLPPPDVAESKRG
jgi:DNA-binding CsgD family transcriptional regulator/tetratricopeptide (TPR) repeat protein